MVAMEIVGLLGILPRRGGEEVSMQFEKLAEKE